MATPPDDKNLVSLIAQEHIGPDSSGDNIGAKRVANYIWNGSSWERQTAAAGGGGLTDTELRASPVEMDIIGENGTSIASGNSIGISLAKYSMQSLFETTTGWSAVGAATSIATTTTHRGEGNNFITFNKTTGNVLALIEHTIPSTDLSAYGLGADGFIWLYLPSTTSISTANIRVGTDSSNYHQWDFAVADLSSGWNRLRAGISEPTTQVGTGYDLSAITYVAVGITTGSAGNTKTGIIFGGGTFERNVNTPEAVGTSLTVTNINLQRVGGTTIEKNAGPLGNGVQRVTLADETIATLTPPAAITGFATATKQDTGNTSLSSIDTKIDALTTPSDTQPVSAASLPLPSGAATAANQSTANSTLASILSALGGGAYASQIDTTTTANTIYIGLADPGTATSAASWQIKKIDTSGPISTTWADGDSSFNNVWDNIASLSYS